MSITWVIIEVKIEAMRYAYVYQTEELKQLSANAFRVYVTLCSFANPDGTGAHPSNSLLMEWCGIKEATLLKCINELEETGFVTRAIAHELNGRRGTYRKFTVHRSMAIGNSSTEFGQSGQDSSEFDDDNHPSLKNNDGGYEMMNPVIKKQGGMPPQNIGIDPPSKNEGAKYQYHKRSIPKENNNDSITLESELVENDGGRSLLLSSKSEPFEADLRPAGTELTTTQVANIRGYGYGWPEKRSQRPLVTLTEENREIIAKTFGEATVDDIRGILCQDMADAPGFVAKCCKVVWDKKSRGGLGNPVGYFDGVVKGTWKGGSYIILQKQEEERQRESDRELQAMYTRRRKEREARTGYRPRNSFG